MCIMVFAHFILLQVMWLCPMTLVLGLIPRDLGRRYPQHWLMHTTSTHWECRYVSECVVCLSPLHSPLAPFLIPLFLLLTSSSLVYTPPHLTPDSPRSPLLLIPPPPHSLPTPSSIFAPSLLTPYPTLPPSYPLSLSFFSLSLSLPPFPRNAVSVKKSGQPRSSPR